MHNKDLRIIQIASNNFKIKAQITLHKGFGMKSSVFENVNLEHITLVKYNQEYFSLKVLSREYTLDCS